jgi:hypothetical protein
VSVALGEFADLLGHDAELGHLGTYEALGRAEHRAGRTLDALQSAYRVGARVAWRRTAALGEAGGVEPRTMYLVAEAIFAYIDRVAAASVAGFTQEEALRASSVQARRQALVELLARVPPAGEAELARAAADAVWTVPARVAALAVAEGTAAALARRMPAGTLGAELPGAGVLVLSDPDGPGQPGVVARALGARRGVLGPAVAPPEAHLSIARAVSALPLHAAGARRPGAVDGPGPRGARPPRRADRGRPRASARDARGVARRPRGRPDGRAGAPRPPADRPLPPRRPARGVRRAAGRPGGAP